MLRFLAAFLLLLSAVAAADAGANPGTVNFAVADPLVDLGKSLVVYHGPSQSAANGWTWYMLTATNDSVRPAARILLAGQSAGASVRFFPQRARPSIRQIASSDAEVTIEPARAYGRHAFRVTIPPASSAALAILVSDDSARPIVYAWSEPALVAHDRQLAIFFAAVAGLMAAALAITGGLALMTGHAAPRWAAVVIGAVFLTTLAGSGVFDAGWFTIIGGPYGFSIMLAGLTLAAGIRLADVIVPVAGIWPQTRQWFGWSVWGIAALSFLSFLGVPGAMLLTEILVVAGSGIVTAYLVHRGRLGSAAARVATPSAAVFSLVAAAAAIAALGGFQNNPAAPAVVGGFAAAGAVLLALAIAAGEGIAVLQVLGSPRPAGLDVAPPQTISNITAGQALEAIAASHQGVFELDFKTKSVKLSSEAAALIGLGPQAVSIPHEKWIARVHPDDRAIYASAISDYRAHPDLAFRIELRARSESGRYPWLELRATMLGGGARAERCLGLIADITGRKEAEASPSEPKLREGLPGRAALVAALDHARFGDVALALIDVDRFKSIHASVGDAGGDSILAALGRRLSQQFADRADVFRAGGDSFALLSKGANEVASETFGAEILKACEGAYPFADRTIFVSVSVGLAHGPANRGSTVLANAERALADAKQYGGGRCSRYSDDLVDMPDAVALETELRQALDCSEFEVFYQPIMSLADASVSGFEALLRWRHPRKGLIEPGEFIVHCEETGLIVAIGRMVLDRAAEDLAQWQQYFPLQPALFSSVNLSRRQLHDNGLRDFLQAALLRHALAAGSLKIEITESAAGSPNSAAALLRDIQSLGIGIAIDDFGTGLSALSELKDLPFDTIKIDKSFLAGKTDDKPEVSVILASIVQLGRDLGKLVIVEGVESEEDAVWLRERGCDFAQGYYFSVPLKADEVLNFIAQHYRSEEPKVSGASGVG